MRVQKTRFLLVISRKLTNKKINIFDYSKEYDSSNRTTKVKLRPLNKNLTTILAESFIRKTILNMFIKKLKSTYSPVSSIIKQNLIQKRTSLFRTVTTQPELANMANLT